MDKMKAAILVEPSKIVCEETSLFEPEAGQVVVKNHMAAICGSDLHQVFYGAYSPKLPAEPGWPGHEGVGEVVESRSDNLKVVNDNKLSSKASVQRSCTAIQTLEQVSVTHCQRVF